jgi:hypothetical protein
MSPRMMPLLEREPHESALANLSFAPFAQPEFVVDRAERSNDLLRRSPHPDAFVPIGDVTVLHRGSGPPREITYTVYRVDWSEVPQAVP